MTAPALEVEVVEQAGDWARHGQIEALVIEATRAMSGHPQVRRRLTDAGVACVALADDATVRVLNRQWRQQDKATNVLSFPAASPARAETLGDIVLALETVEREAAEQGIPFAHHLQHLVVHGLLHLLGLDHETEAQAREMEAIEVEVLAGLDVADPYKDELV